LRDIEIIIGTLRIPMVVNLKEINNNNNNNNNNNRPRGLG